MRSVKIKTLVVWLFMVVVVRFGTASQPELTLQRYIDEEMYIVGDNPKIGEIFEVVYRITVKATADWAERKSYLTHNYAAVIRGPAEALEIIGQDKFFFSGLEIGETKEFRVHCRILKSWNWIQITGSVELVYQGKIRGDVAGKAGIPLYLINPETGQYGTKEEYEGKLPVEYRYDPVDGSFTCSPSQNPAPVEENRRIIKMIKELEPRLSDSLALLLHSDQYRVGVPKGLPIWDEEKQRWIEEEIFKYYLNDGWFEALQEGRREAWIIQEREKIMKEVDKHKLNFFRDNNTFDIDYISSDNSSPKERITTTFIGTWRYQDHLYNKDNGLLWSYTVKPVKTAEVGIRARLI